MPIRISDASSLTPRLLGRTAGTAVRIEGVLLRDGGSETVLVKAVDYDGEQCRYRSLHRDTPWIAEREDDEFRSCSQTIMDGLRSSDPGDSVLSIVDSVITDAGALMVAVRNEVGGGCRWMTLPA